MPLNIKLINMPFALLSAPSLGLTQLKAVTRSAFPRDVAVELLYVNHDFGRMLGPRAFSVIATTQAGLVSGLGEWLFRRAAFPDAPDNQAAFVTRYGHHFRNIEGGTFFRSCEVLRDQMDAVLDGIIDRYGIADADVVGLTSTFFQNLACIALAQRLRRRNREQLIVMGGANCESSMGIELVNNVPIIDFVFSGGSLRSFPQLIGHVLSGDREACHRIDGVFSRRNSRSITTVVPEGCDVDWGKLRTRPQLEGIAEIGQELDINTEIELDYDDYFESLQNNVPDVAQKPMLMFETSRGCWWGERAHCTFCGLNGSAMAYRAMHPDRALALIERLIARYGDRTETLQCVDNIMPKEYVEGVFGRLRVAEHLCIYYEVKSDLRDEELRTLARGGVRRVQPGIEALATSTLKLMRKGTTAFRNISFLANCKAHGIEPMWNLLIGFPGETESVYAEYAQVLPTLFHLPPPTGVYPVRFDRFSPYFTQQREYRLQLAPYDFYPLCYPFAEASLMCMAYYFQDKNVDAAYARDAAAWLGRLGDIIKRWQHLWAAGASGPKLEFSPTAGYVADTRGGGQRRILLTPTERAVLDAIIDPLGEERILDEHQEALRSVIRKGFVFRERSRVMSLVAGYPA